MPPGSERFIGVWFLDGVDGEAVGNLLGGDYAKYLGFETGVDETVRLQLEQRDYWQSNSEMAQIFVNLRGCGPVDVDVDIAVHKKRC